MAENRAATCVKLRTGGFPAHVFAPSHFAGVLIKMGPRDMVVAHERVEPAERGRALRRRCARTRLRRARRRRSTTALRALGLRPDARSPPPHRRSTSAHATAAPSRAASTEIARPLPTGASGSSDGRVPAPTTSTRRPDRRAVTAEVYVSRVMTELEDVAPAFVEMAHRIVWCSVATVDHQGRPRSRILHPLWEWDGERARRLDRDRPDADQAVAPRPQPVRVVSATGPTTTTRAPPNAEPSGTSTTRHAPRCGTSSWTRRRPSVTTRRSSPRGRARPPTRSRCCGSNRGACACFPGPCCC